MRGVVPCRHRRKADAGEAAGTAHLARVVTAGPPSPSPRQGTHRPFRGAAPAGCRQDLPPAAPV